MNPLDNEWDAVENRGGADELAFPLSFAQQRLWILDQLEENTSAYNIPIALRLRGELSLEALNHAFTEILRRHEVLRARFEPHGEGPQQIISPVQSVVLPVTDLSSLREQERILRAERLAKEEANKPFNLAQGPVIRISLLKLGAADHVLLVTVHHIAFDGWSQQIFLRELRGLYHAFVSAQQPLVPELPLQYTDFGVWQREYLAGRRLEEQLKYWKEKLGGAPGVLDLPTDHPRPPRQSFRGSKISTLLPASLVEKIEELSRKEGVTFFMTLLAAFNVLLGRYSGQEDIVVGSPIAGRNRVELENLIGLFVNTLALRTDLSGDPTFRELLVRVREVTLGAYAHQECPYEKIVEDLKPDRDLSRNPIFQVMLVLQNLPRETEAASGLQITSFGSSEKTSAKFDLLVAATRQPEGLRLTFEYSTHLFEPATIARMQQHFRTLLEGISRNPELALSDLPLLTAEERTQVLYGWNKTAAAVPTTCIHQLFEQQVQRTPAALALSFRDESLSYGELNRRANLLARYLQKRGVGPEVLVGIYMDRSPAMVVALLAVLKAGGAYVPLDPSFPQARIQFLLDDAEPAIVLTQDALLGKLPKTSAEIVSLDGRWPEISAGRAENVQSQATPSNVAYVLYTSGSTGKPKGVLIEHASVVNFLTSMQREPGLRAEDTLLALTTLSFDIAALEIFLPLISGAHLAIASRDEAIDPNQLIARMRTSRPTVMQATPATWRMLLEGGWHGNPELKILCGGEALPSDLAARLRGMCRELWNLYGPTETTIWSTCWLVGGFDSAVAPIGRPIANTQLYVLDKKRQPVPVGAVGELYIGGAGLARGYWKRPELDEEKFVANPFIPGTRVYRTGDLVRYLSDGTLQYIGRVDHQVKLRGFRIELGEIESLLSTCPGVRQNAVVLREHRPGDRELVAYVVADEFRDELTAKWREVLAQQLPQYMVPNNFVSLPELPLTPNRKIDRKRLAEREVERSQRASSVQPRDKLEAKLAEIWQRVLGISQVGIDEDFFELGGHSLLAVRLVSEIRKETGQEIPLATLFQGATIEYLAGIIGEGRKPAHRMVMAVQAAGSKPPFFGIVTPGVNPLGYIALARHLGDDQPLYEIQGPGPRERKPYSAQEFEQLAADYIREMRKIQPRGPYHFGGMCEGARIAFDMARLLEAEGEKVSLLAILDTWVLENSQNRLLWRIDYYSGRLKGFWRGSRQEKWRAFRRWAENRYGTNPAPRLWPKAYWPGKDFVPAKYSGKITVFKTPKQPFYYINDPLLGWGTRTTGAVEVKVIRSRHLMLLREPYVRALAPALLESLERAQADADHAQTEKEALALQNNLALATSADPSGAARTRLRHSDQQT